MLHEFTANLADWGPLDTWTVITASLAAMACALPGNFLLLRRQSMMGDALSHTALLGIVLAFLISQWLRVDGGVADGGHGGHPHSGMHHALMFSGAIGIGVVTGWLTEWVQNFGRVEANSALGVVFTSLFALALLILHAWVRDVDLHPDCVLLGSVETAYLTRYDFGVFQIPEAALINGAVLLLNLLLLGVFFKELRISTFDPSLATTQGINARGMHYALMAVTAMTVVAAFESVGSILVIAMLIVPAATAKLLSDRLSIMVLISLGVAALSGVLGHVMALTLPSIVFRRLAGWVESEDVQREFLNVEDASTSGMMALTAGSLFLLALFLSPRHGVLSKLIVRSRLRLRIAGEDLLGVLYRLEETGHEGDTRSASRWVQEMRGAGSVLTFLAVLLLKRSGKIVAAENGFRLTEKGRQEAKQLVRSHRLWESYLARHFNLPEDHLHESASRVEHYVDPRIREELADELDDADVDPHGRTIPPEPGEDQSDEPTK